jgi:hypothetical protein
VPRPHSRAAGASVRSWSSRADAVRPPCRGLHPGLLTALTVQCALRPLLALPGLQLLPSRAMLLTCPDLAAPAACPKPRWICSSCRASPAATAAAAPSLMGRRVGVRTSCSGVHCAPLPCSPRTLAHRAGLPSGQGMGEP